MIPKVAKSGHSFKGAAAYYLHDKTQDNDFNQASGAKAQSADRVEWTETRNLATDNPDTAWKVMSATAMNADNLKAQNREAEGKRAQASGQTNAKNVYAYSLAWSPEEQGKITREEMTTAAEDTLERLGFKDHQAMFICHNDTDHPHVHVLVNKVNPETGKSHNPHRDFNKLDKWANDYRKDRGEEHLCPNRAKKWENHDEGKSNKNREKQTNTRLDSDQHKTMSADDPRAAKVRKDQAAWGNRVSEIGKRQDTRHKEQWERFKERNKTRKSDIYDRYKAPMDDAKKRRDTAYKEKGAIYDKFKDATAQRVQQIKDAYAPARSQIGKKNWQTKRNWEARDNTLHGRIGNAIAAAYIGRNSASSKGMVKDSLKNLVNTTERTAALDTLQRVEWNKLNKAMQADIGAAKKEMNASRAQDLKPAQEAYSAAKQDVSNLFRHRKGELAGVKAARDGEFNDLKTNQASDRQRLQSVWGKLKTRRAKALKSLSNKLDNKAQQRHAHDQSLNARFKDKAEDEAKTKTRNRNRSKARKPRTRGQSYRHKPE